MFIYDGVQWGGVQENFWKKNSECNIKDPKLCDCTGGSKIMVDDCLNLEFTNSPEFLAAIESPLDQSTFTPN